jgi:ABC-type glycerol-3-phosphate transport system substrate-binding protein
VKLGRTIIAAASVVALSATMVACSSGGSSTSDKQKVTFWQFDTAQASIDAYKTAIKDFEKKNPTITVDMQIVPWADQQQKITTALASGALPDVSMLGNDVVAQYAANGSLAPLDSYLAGWSKEEGTDVKKDMYDGDVSYYTYKGKLYGSPVADETRMVYYNKDLFQKAGLDPNTPPTTWDEMEKDAKALKSVVSVPWSAPMSKQYVTVQTFMSIYLSYGASLFNSKGQCGLNTSEFKDALTWYTGIAKDGLTSPDAVNATSDDIANLFSNGKAGMLIDGPSRYNAIKTANPDLFKNIGVAAIPAGPKGQFGFLGGWPLVMWNTSKVKDAAAKWIHYATSPDGALSQIAQTSGILPGRQSLASKSPWTDAPYDQFAKQLSKAYAYQYPAGPSPKMGEIETASIQTAVQQVASGALNVDDATKALCTDINNILAK